MTPAYETMESISSPALPVYDDAELARLATPELWHLLVRNEDRVPRNLIDECARRGDGIVDLANAILDKDYYWGDDLSRGESWLILHAVMILGLIPDERAGRVLTGYMCRVAGDDDLQDWLSSYWPALFRNKPFSQVDLVKSVAEDDAIGWFMRFEAIGTAVAMAETHGVELLDTTLEWAASFAFDEKEDESLRDLVGGTLLDFARPEYRARLEALADADFVANFDRDDIERIYAAGGDAHYWAEMADPWSFYSPAEIEARQRRWSEEDSRAEDEDVFEGKDALEDNDNFEVVETYVRPTPKIGRNDPCPCGSGKKYKKCCLGAGSQN